MKDSVLWHRGSTEDNYTVTRVKACSVLCCTLFVLKVIVMNETAGVF